MPSASKKQHNFMQAVAHSPAFAKKVGVPQSVGKDFSAADKGRKFSKGGDMANTSRMNRLEELGRVDAEKAFTSKGKKNLAAEKKRVVGSLAAHAAMPASKAHAGLKGGGYVRAADGIASKGKTKGTMIAMCGGGKM